MPRLQVPRDPEDADGERRGEAAHPQSGVRSVEEPPAGTAAAAAKAGVMAAVM